jgi:hypothetical protein
LIGNELEWKVVLGMVVDASWIHGGIRERFKEAAVVFRLDRSATSIALNEVEVFHCEGLECNIARGMVGDAS